MIESERLDKAQRRLNVAWIGAGVGWLSSMAGMVLGLPIHIIEPWLYLCAGVAVWALLLALITMTAEAPEE